MKCGVRMTLQELAGRVRVAPSNYGGVYQKSLRNKGPLRKLRKPQYIITV
jgi:hypothetical protein